MEDIAVVGIGLRFPGTAKDPEQFWEGLKRGESQWSEFSQDRLNIDGFYHPSGDRQGSISFRGAHLLKGDLGAFDAPFFSIASEDAKAIDPQQRILLEVCYEALENAGLRKEDLDGSDTSVYVGSFVKDYEQICLRDPDWQPQYAATGNGIAIMANRLSYFFNFHGPSMTVDTGCSGSLVSVHLAAQSLRNGESSVAIAAGAGLILTPATMMPMTALNFLSPDGKCFTFDARANGYGRGEGVGVAVLKRISDAIRDNDTIRAVIRGSQINQDGRTTGITLPSKEAQVANIRSLYASSGLEFDQTAYVECHGTGTQAGDWRELKAISETLATKRSTKDPILVGSVKPNIGHLEGAAGVAGLIKGVLMLEKGKIPPNINFENGNPHIDFENWKVKVPRELVQWPIDGVRRVSVNCFGFGGTNAHVIMDQAPCSPLDNAQYADHGSVHNTSAENSSIQELQLFCYSSNEKAGVQRIMTSHVDYLRPEINQNSLTKLRNYAYTLACRRSNLEWRGTIIATSAAELIAKINSPQPADVTRSLNQSDLRVCFIFCGQGAQWPQMGRELMAYDIFCQSMEEASQYLKKFLQSPFDLLREIFRIEGDSALSYPHISQPATTALQVALVDLLNSLHIRPHHVVGHSSGEIAAAYAGGAISRYSAWEVAYFRGLAAVSIPLRAPKLRGGMLAVGMSVEDMESYLIAGYWAAEVACVNSPRSVTIAGRSEVIDNLHADLRTRKVFCRSLNVQTAYHSSHMKLVEGDYRDSLSCVDARDFDASITMISSVTGKMVKGSELDASYWCDNMLSPVRYMTAIETMMQLPSNERPTIMIELGPRASLRSPTTDTIGMLCSGQHCPSYYSILQPKSDGISNLLSMCGKLWSTGLSVQMQNLFKTRNTSTLKCLSDLPPYPWNHAKSYWHESHLSLSNRFRPHGRQDLIGAPTADSTPFEPRWRGFLRLSENPWLQDHQVQKTIVYPAAGMICMVLEGARQMEPDISNILGYEIRCLKIERAMIIPSTNHGLEVALNIKTARDNGEQCQTNGSHEFAIYSKQLGHSWDKNATGFVTFTKKAPTSPSSAPVFDKQDMVFRQLQDSCTEAVNSRQLYELLDTMGMNYGPLFKNISCVRKGDGACIYQIRVPDTRSKMPGKFEYPHLIHPATLDSMFHSLFAIETTPMVPTFIKNFFISASLISERCDSFAGCAAASRVGIQNAKATILMKHSGTLEPLVLIEDLHLTAITAYSSESSKFLPNYRNLCTEVIWREDSAFAAPSDYVELLGLMAHKQPGLSVLQIGGDLPDTLKIVDVLCADHSETPRLSRFTLLPQSNQDIVGQLQTHVQGTPLEPFFEYKNDISERANDYHCIFVFENSNIADENLRPCLLPGGFIVTKTPRTSRDGSESTIMGGKYAQPLGPRATIEPGFTLYQQPISLEIPTSPERIIVLLPEQAEADVLALAKELSSIRNDTNNESIVYLRTPLDVMADLSFIDESIVISLLELSASDNSHGSVFWWDAFSFDMFKAVRKVAKGMMWITRASHMEPHRPQSAVVIGLSRTLMSEDPSREVVVVDVDNSLHVAELTVATTIMKILDQKFHSRLSSIDQETEYSLKNDKVFIPRLSNIQPLNHVIEGRSQYCVNHQLFLPEGIGASSHAELKLTISKPGLVDEALYYTEFQYPDLKHDEVDIEFREALLTTEDVATAMGQTIESTIGIDVVGKISRVGRDVSQYRPGDDVSAVTTGGSIQSTIRTKIRLVADPLFGPMTSMYILAYYALVHIGRLQPRKTVLIHAGSSSHGIAAIEIAKAVGAEIFVTVLGFNITGQKLILRKCGILDDHILDASGDDFVAGIHSMTGGKGVDALYNPTQYHLDTNMRCAKSCGSVVQIASKASFTSTRTVTDSSLAMINVDFKQLLSEDEDFVVELLHRTTQLLTNNGGSNRSKGLECPTTSYAIDDLHSALTHIQQHPYLGICTITASPDSELKVPVLCSNPTKPLTKAIDPTGTYLLVGGLGGLGRSIAELLVANGAKYLAFASRSGAPTSDGVANFIDHLEQMDVVVRVFKADICDENSISTVIRNDITPQMPSIAGVFQCAAVIRDAVFDNMTFEDWDAAIKPKTLGSWNLVKTMQDTDHKPFFIFLASSAGVIGNRGQANYAAGNSFLDSLARYCRLNGTAAVSIDLGPVLGAGMLTENEDTLDKLRASGFYGIRYEDFLTVVKHAITMELDPETETPAQIILGVGTGGLLKQNKPADPYWSRTALYSYLNLIDMPPPDLNAATDTHSMDMKTMLARCPNPDAAADMIRTGLANMLAKAMNLLPEEVDVNKPPNAYGVDSLVAVGVRNWVLSTCGVQVSVFDVLSDSTVAEMATMVASRGEYGSV